jgi:hypothetical protein
METLKVAESATSAEDLVALKDLMQQWYDPKDQKPLIFDGQKLVIASLANVIRRTQFAPYNLTNNGNLKAASYQDHRMGTMMACIAHILSKGLDEPYPPEFAFTATHFKKPVFYSPIWTTLFPKCQPTNPSGRGAYALPFLIQADMGIAVQKPTPKTFTKAPHLHATCLSKIPEDTSQLILMHEHARERVAIALSSGITPYPLCAYILAMPGPHAISARCVQQIFLLPRMLLDTLVFMCSLYTCTLCPADFSVAKNAVGHSCMHVGEDHVGNHLHGICSFACCSLSYPPQPAQKDVMTYSQYNHQIQLTVPGSVYTLRISGYPVPMGDKILAQAQSNDFLALTRKIAQETGNMPLIQGTQWAPLQDALNTIGCDHRAFPLPSHWTPSAILTGHEPGIHDAVSKQIGEFSLPLKAGLKMTLFPLKEIKCSYPGPTVNGVPGPPCNKSVACSSFRIIVDNTPCSTPRNDLGIHVNFGPFQEVMCNHFICNECLPHWHKEVIGELTHPLESPSGSKVPVRCFIPSCDCTVGDPSVLEETMCPCLARPGTDNLVGE